MSNFIRYADIRPGDIIHSSHGYRILVTELKDSAKETRSPDRHVEISGYIHADKGRKIVTERHSAYLAVKVDDLDSTFDEGES